MITHKDVADCLEQAATVIETNGLHQGSLYRARRGKGPHLYAVCAQGAINIAAHGSPLNPDQYATDGGRAYALVVSASRALRAYTSILDVPAWSDAPGRTSADVATAFRTAAKAAEKAGE